VASVRLSSGRCISSWFYTKSITFLRPAVHSAPLGLGSSAFCSSTEFRKFDLLTLYCKVKIKIFPLCTKRHSVKKYVK
jgi:hypothetical protein